MVSPRRDDPLALGYDGMQELHIQDRVLYKGYNDPQFTPAIVAKEPGSTGIYIRLLRCHLRESKTFEKGSEILAGANEIFWDRNEHLPGRLREVLIK